MIPLGDLYRIIVVVYLLQLYQNCSRLLGHVYCDSFFRHLLGHFFRHPLGYPLGHPLGYPLGYFLGYPLRHSLGYFLGHPLGYPIQSQNCYFYSRA